jgi:hypothetical protein
LLGQNKKKRVAAQLSFFSGYSKKKSRGYIKNGRYFFVLAM